MTKSLIERWRLTVAASICLVLFVLVAWTSHTSSRLNQNNDVQVSNKTTAIQIVSVEKDDRGYLLRLRNGADKSINGYSLLLGDGGIITTDYTVSGKVIAPGEVTEALVPISDPAVQEKITIISVVFTDNSSEGDNSAATNIKHRRMGVKLQLKRILPLLKALADKSDTEISTELRKLKPQIQALPEQAENGMPQAISEGMHDAKQDTLRLIQRLEQKQALNLMELRKELTRQLAEQEKRVARL